MNIANRQGAGLWPLRSHPHIAGWTAAGTSRSRSRSRLILRSCFFLLVRQFIPDTSTARRWNLLSDASSSAVIKSLDWIPVTATPCPLVPPAHASRPTAFLLLQRKLSGTSDTPPP